VLLASFIDYVQARGDYVTNFFLSLVSMSAVLFVFFPGVVSVRTNTGYVPSIVPRSPLYTHQASTFCQRETYMGSRAQWRPVTLASEPYAGGGGASRRQQRDTQHSDCVTTQAILRTSNEARLRLWWWLPALADEPRFRPSSFPTSEII
jgi:hypothetical protein